MTAQQITEGCNAEWVEKKQSEAFFWARTEMQGATQQVWDVKLRVDKIQASGSFDTIDKTMTQAMLRWKTILNNLLVAVNQDAEVKALFEWTP